MADKKTKDKREILVYRILAVLSFVFGFIAIFVSIILDERSPDSNWITYGIIVFLVFNVVGLYLQNQIKADKEISRLKNRAKFYENLEIKEIDSLDKETLKERIIDNGYELLSNGYYFKRSKAQGLCYYLKLVSFPKLDDFLEKELMRFKKFYDQGCKKINGILLVEMNEVNEADKLKIKELSKGFLILEEAPINNSTLSVNVCLIDKSTSKTFYYESPESYTTRIYTFGSLVIRKIFNNKK